MKRGSEHFAAGARTVLDFQRGVLASIKADTPWSGRKLEVNKAIVECLTIVIQGAEENAMARITHLYEEVKE